MKGPLREECSDMSLGLKALPVWASMTAVLLSAGLARVDGLMPVVGIITEPAIGPGADVGLVFLQRAADQRGKAMSARRLPSDCCH